MKRYKTLKKSGRKDQDRGNLLSPVEPALGKLHSSVQWVQRRPSQRHAPDEPTMDKVKASVQWTQKLRLGFSTGWTDDGKIEYVGATAEEEQERCIHRLNRWCTGQSRRCSCPETPLFGGSEDYMHRLNQRWSSRASVHWSSSRWSSNG